LAVMTVLLFCRRPDAFLNPQFWGEDGTIFFKEQIEYGFKSIVIPYAGYLHLTPRLIACAASLFPFSITPTIYNFFALSAMLFTGGALFSSRCRFPFKPLLALSMIVVPHYGEVFMTVTNIQWYLCFLPLILLYSEPPVKSYQYFLDYLIIILCGLTGPFILLLLPLFFIKCFIQKSHYNYGILLTAFLCALIQGWCFLKTGNGENMGTSGNINAWINLVGFRFFWQLFFGNRFSYLISPKILAIFAVMTPALLLWYANSKEHRYFIGSFLFFGLSVALSLFYRVRSCPEIIAYDSMNAERYFYIPYVMTIWSLIICLDSPKLFKRIAISGLLLLILNASSNQFRTIPFVDYKWKEYSEKIKTGEPVRIPINPPGWFIDLYF
jgi:hypothetical protein